MGKHTQTRSVWLRADVFKLIFTTDCDILSVFLSKLLNSLESYGYIARCDNGYKPCVVAIDDVKVNECRNAFTDAERLIV